MIKLYGWGTPNPRKITVMLEEIGMPYEIVTIDPMGPAITSPELLEVSPNGKIPAIVDMEGPGRKPLFLFESGAILIYLAEKAASDLLPEDPALRANTHQWLMWQMAGIGPMIGQYFHFQNLAPEKLPYAIDRYATEMHRLIRVLDDQLAKDTYVAGSQYTIADIAIYAWIAMIPDVMGVDLTPYANVRRWLAVVGERPAVKRGMAQPDVFDEKAPS